MTTNNPMGATVVEVFEPAMGLGKKRPAFENPASAEEKKRSLRRESIHLRKKTELGKAGKRYHEKCRYRNYAVSNNGCNKKTARYHLGKRGDKIITTPLTLRFPKTTCWAKGDRKPYEPLTKFVQLRLSMRSQIETGDVETVNKKIF